MDGSEGEGGCRDVYSGELGYIVCSDDLSALTINLLRRYCGDRSRLVLEVDEGYEVGGTRLYDGKDYGGKDNGLQYGGTCAVCTL